MRLEKNLNKLDIIDKFFIIWSFFIPITSFVLMPSVKGSLISYILAFISPLIILFKRRNFLKKYIIYFGGVAYIWLAFFCLSQLGNHIYNINISDLILISNETSDIKVFRNSIFTQTLYLLPCILLYLYCKNFYNTKWDKWIVYSGWLFSVIGLYFWVYSLLTGENGDIISNRVFADSTEVTNIPQGVDILSIGFQRVQSLSGEPSMYAFTILPYIIFAIHRKANKILIATMILSLLLSVSTTGFLGILIYIICVLFFSKINKKYIKNLIIFIGILIFIYFLFSVYIDEIVMNIIINKITADSTNVSGVERSANIIDNIIYWSNLDNINFLFGIGFGVIRSTDLLTTFLVNIGLIGTLLFAYFYLRKITLRNLTMKKIGDNAILLVLFITSMISVPEFSYLSFWLFLGLINSKNN